MSKACKPVRGNIEEDFGKDDDDVENFVQNEAFPLSRLNTTEDVQAFFDHAVFSLREKDFENLGKVLNTLNAVRLQPEGMKNAISQEFQLFLLQILKEDKKKNIDHHHLMRILTIAQNLLQTKSTDELDSEDVDKLFITLFSKVSKKKLEVFSCGCIQDNILKLYKRDGKTRFCTVIKQVIQEKLRNEGMIKPRFEKLIGFHSSFFSSPPDVYELYLETIREMVAMKYIKYDSDELLVQRLPHLIELLNNFSNEVFCKATEKLNSMIISIEKTSSPNKYLSKAFKILVAKVFDFIEKIDGRQEKDMERWEGAIRDGNFFKLNNMDVFNPLILLESFLNGWKDMEQVLIKRYETSLANLKIDSPHFLPLSVYILRLSKIAKSKQSEKIISDFLKIISDNYENSTLSTKETVISLVDMIESPTMRPKQKLLLDSDPTVSANTFLAIRNIATFSEVEIKHFFNKWESSLDEEHWARIFRELAKFQEPINSDIVWKMAIARSMSDSNSVQFITEQIKVMAEKADKSLKSRMNQIISNFKRTLNVETIKSNNKIILAFVESVLSSKSESFDPMFCNDLIPLLIISYCCYFDKHELKIRNLFRKLVQRIESRLKFHGESISENEDDVMKLICRLCELSIVTFSTTSSCCNLRKWAGLASPQSPNGEIYGQLLSKIAKTSESNQDAKFRIISVFSLIFCKLSSYLRKVSETGVSAYCIFSNTVQTQLSIIFSTKVDDDQKYSKIAIQLCNGFTKAEKDWNLTFVFARLEKLLESVKKHPTLHGKLVELISKNQHLARIRK